MTHAATFSLSYPDEERAVRVERSLRPEVDDIGGDRTGATLDRAGRTLSITVDAADLVALRAGLNTWLTLASVAERAGRISGTDDGPDDETGDGSDGGADGETNDAETDQDADVSP